ncbi:MAG: hypothetical protein JEZ03_07850 [Bacteroidales bacterium]|nr:hypothetical protein [Bacteroidales bacterium]
MERRGIKHDAIDELKEKLSNSQTAILVNGIQDHQNASAEELVGNIPALYTPQTIYFASILINFIFGGVLFIMNLFAVKAKGKIETSIFIILFLLTEYSFFKDGQIDPIMALLLNGVGGIVLNLVFWRRYLGTGRAYKKRSAWKPLVIGLAVSLILMYFFGNVLMPTV